MWILCVIIIDLIGIGKPQLCARGRATAYASVFTLWFYLDLVPRPLFHRTVDMRHTAVKLRIYGCLSNKPHGPKKDFGEKKSIKMKTDKCKVKPGIYVLIYTRHLENMRWYFTVRVKF